MSRLLAPEQTDEHSVADLLTPGTLRPRSPVPTAGDSFIQRQCRSVMRRALDRISAGSLTIRDADQTCHYGTSDLGRIEADITVHDPRLYTSVVLGGTLGAAEAYLRGYWDTPDLVATLRLFAVNAPALAAMDSWGAQLVRPLRASWRWMHRNTRTGSRRNIAAHYDLSNEFFALMLDPTMTYSSAIFDDPSMTLAEASTAKYDRVCRKLQLGPHDHVLEIGTGWGGFALHAAHHYGCRVTTATISRQQYAWARERVADRGLADRVSVLLRDYRDLTGPFDKLVSIEMVEAVGEKMFDTFFGQCSRLLRHDGMMLLQAITIPDYRYAQYRQTVDFINRYIFPGGFLPSFSAIGRSLRRATDFRPVHLEAFGLHYAETLRRWRANFWDNIDRVLALGFDQRFVRMWHYYLCYCEAGFRESQIDASQMLLLKSGCRGEGLVAV